MYMITLRYDPMRAQHRTRPANSSLSRSHGPQPVAHKAKSRSRTRTFSYLLRERKRGRGRGREQRSARHTLLAESRQHLRSICVISLASSAGLVHPPEQDADADLRSFSRHAVPAAVVANRSSWGPRPASLRVELEGEAQGSERRSQSLELKLELEESGSYLAYARQSFGSWPFTLSSWDGANAGWAWREAEAAGSGSTSTYSPSSARVSWFARLPATVGGPASRAEPT
ncbi:hypothetical protein C8Q80DRAFT_1119911 [Daedaleopsis nitida]|nr:hypothetical protein C8Q80DRAFT_1119911 [Daedaleopsis nitida]